MSQLFTSGGQSIRASVSVSVLPKKLQGWFPLGLTGLISLLSKGLSRPFQGRLQHRSSKESILQCSALFMVQLWHPYMTTGKSIDLTTWNFAGKVMSLLFHILSRLVFAFLPRRKRLLISCLKSPSAVILEPPKIWSLSLFPLFPHLFTMKWWDQIPWSSFFECWDLS